MEKEPDTENVVFMDESRRAKWLVELERNRKLGGIATFGHGDYDKPADVLRFPTEKARSNPDGLPDGAA